MLLDGAQLDLERLSDVIEDAVGAILLGDAESDLLNGLVTRAAVPWGDVQILRAYRRYRQMVRREFTETYQSQVLIDHAETAALIVGLFHARFGRPDAPVVEGELDELRDAISARIDAVPSLDEDRILRGFLQLVLATVRTNAYRPERGRRLSLKLRSADVPSMPAPAPLYEIFVCDPEMEGIHLRGGLVARGGIRWSDRREDYRTEVLGLMKAQKVKNAVIVPDGSKGGFVLKHPPSGRDELRDEVRRQYSTLIRGLLDVTDTMVAGAVVHPRACACTTATIRTSSSRPTRAPRRSRTRRTRSRSSTGSGSGTRSPRAARPATTTRPSGSPRAGPGRACAATSASSGTTPSASRSRSSASATCPATSSATGCCARIRSA